MPPNNKVRPRGSIILIAVLFCISLSPALPQVSTYHSDEHFYTDSAVYMLQQGDFLTPHYSDGRLRTKKPIVTYWVLMASYMLMGVNFFAARLPFLIAGAATVWLTYRFALRLFQSQRTALLAAAILASNMQFIMLCLRATPDILQTYFMLLSLYGFCALVFDEDFSLQHILFCYLGAALAILTKGLLGAVLIAYMVLYLIFVRKQGLKLNRFLHWPVIGLAITMALWWYAYIYLKHGAPALLTFYTDQVTGKVDSSKFYIFSNIAEYLWGVFRNYIPWSLMLLAGAFTGWPSIRRFYGQYRRQVWFVLGWFGLLLAIFSLSTDLRIRYLVPGYPLLSILCAALFWEIFDHPRIRKMWNWCCGFMLALLGVLGMLLTWAGTLLAWQWIAGGMLLLALTAWGVKEMLTEKQKLTPVAVGMLLVLSVAAMRSLVVPPFEFAPSKRLLDCLLPEVASGRTTSVWTGNRGNHLRQLYTMSKGLIRVNYSPRNQMPRDLEPTAVIILTGDEKETFNDHAYELQPCGAIFQDPDIGTVIQGLVSRDKERIMDSIQTPIYLARQKR